MNKYSVRLCPTTWDRYHLYKEATEVVFGIDPITAPAMSLIRISHNALLDAFNTAPDLRSLPLACTEAASRSIQDGLPEGVISDVLIRHVLIYHCLEALPLITDRLFISPDGELLFRGVLEDCPSGVLVQPEGWVGEKGWLLEEVEVVKPGDEVLLTRRMAFSTRITKKYNGGDLLGQIAAEFDRARDEDCILVPFSSCNVLSAKAEVVK